MVIAGFATWHTLHEEARRVLDRRPRVVGHAMVESYSVLTRLPAPHRAAGRVVVEFLEASFPEEPLVLDAAALRAFALGLAGLDITGGSVYDALIGSTALAWRQELVTCDSRARRIYQQVGCRVRHLG